MQQNKLTEVINDELDAMSQYAAMARDTANPTLKMLLSSIAADEYGHSRVFITMQELMKNWDDAAYSVNCMQIYSKLGIKPASPFTSIFAPWGFCHQQKPRASRQGLT